MSDLFTRASSKTQLVENIKQQFLRFHLDPDVEVMLGLQQITEVLKIRVEQIVPIPQMPPWVMGVYNWRGDILWMLDLGHLIGLQPWYRQQINRGDRNAVVLSPNRARLQAVNNIHLGLVVSQVEDLEECDSTAIQSNFGSTTENLTRFASGYWLKPEGQIISILDGDAIADAMPKSAK